MPKPKDKKKKDLEHPDEDIKSKDEESEEEDLSEELEEEDELPEEEVSSKKKKEKVVKKKEVEEEEEPEEEVEPEEEEELSFIDEEEMSAEEKIVANKVNERMKKAFNKKLTELDKKYKGKKLVGNFDELLDNEEFMTWAEKQLTSRDRQQMDVSRMTMDEAVQSWNSFTDVQRRTFFTALKPEQRTMFKLQLQMAQLAQQAYGSREAELEGKVVEKFGDSYNEKKNAVIQLRKEIQSNPYLTHEEAFKILDYTDYGKRMYMLGKMKGKKNVDEIVKLPRKGGAAGKSSKKKATSIAEAMEMAETEEAEG